jgi:hypothetical protein
MLTVGAFVRLAHGIGELKAKPSDDVANGIRRSAIAGRSESVTGDATELDIVEFVAADRDALAAGANDTHIISPMLGFARSGAGSPPFGDAVINHSRT